MLYVLLRKYTEDRSCHEVEWSENILFGGRHLLIWRPPLKLSGGRHIKYSLSHVALTLGQLMQQQSDPCQGQKARDGSVFRPVPRSEGERWQRIQTRAKVRRREMAAYSGPCQGQKARDGSVFRPVPRSEGERWQRIQARAKVRRRGMAAYSDPCQGQKARDGSVFRPVPRSEGERWQRIQTRAKVRRREMAGILDEKDDKALWTAMNWKGEYQVAPGGIPAEEEFKAQIQSTKHLLNPADSPPLELDPNVLCPYVPVLHDLFQVEEVKEVLT